MITFYVFTSLILIYSLPASGDLCVCVYVCMWESLFYNAVLGVLSNFAIISLGKRAG